MKSKDSNGKDGFGIDADSTTNQHISTESRLDGGEGQ